MPRPTQGFNVESELSHSGYEFCTDSRPGVIVDAALSFEDWTTQELADDYRLGNQDLPVFDYKDTIVNTVAQSPVTIIVAETGAGKSTQVPQFLLETGNYRTIYETQPRRPAARNIFRRLQDEVSEKRGRFAGEELVAYQTAGEKEGPDDATIKVVTDGLQLIKELRDRGAGDRDVLIIDEVHEWNSNVEVLVAWTKKALRENPDLRVVLMSATMDADHLASYYEDISDAKPPIINVPGRNFAVAWQEKPESTVVSEVVSIVNSMQSKDGTLPAGLRGVLVFEPGKSEIQDAISQLQKRIPEDMRSKIKIFPLHAKLSPQQQQAALTEYPDCIKIVVATEVAEASLTIPDIKYVVDSGYKRQSHVDGEGTKGLGLIPASKASCRQRAGRVGRVEDGVYILTRMDETMPYTSFRDRDAYPLAEILRTDVQRNVLRLKVLGIEMANFDMYHKASQRILGLADVNLELLDAVNEDGTITAMAELMDMYPLSTSSARIMVESMGYPPVIRSYLAAITAAKEVGGLRYYSRATTRRWQELTNEETSDLLVQLDLFIAAQDMTARDIADYDLDFNNIMRSREQFPKIAALAGASGQALRPPTPEEREQIKKCSYVGFLNSIYVHEGEGKYVNIANKDLKTPREISKRSVVTTRPQVVLGDPWRPQVFEDGELQYKHLLENVTVPNLQDLATVATRFMTWRHETYELREGKYYARERQHLFDMDLGLEPRLMPAEPSPRLRAEIIDHAIKRPGAEQRRLRQLKKELEELGHKAKDPVRQLTHDQLVMMVHEAAPADITTPATIEDNLRLLALTLDNFEPAERLAEIIGNAPSVIEVGGAVFPVRYQNRKPLVRVRNPHVVAAIGADDARLPDGREVFFVYQNERGDTRSYTLRELKYRFGY